MSEACRWKSQSTCTYSIPLAIAGAEVPNRQGEWGPLPVREPVVFAMVRHPGDRRALEGEAAGDREGDVQWPVGFEGTMGPVPVEIHGHAQRGEAAHHHRERDIHRSDTPPPGDGHRHDQRQEGQANHRVENDTIPCARQGVRFRHVSLR